MKKKDDPVRELNEIYELMIMLAIVAVAFAVCFFVTIFSYL
jgi:hypothetical protein